MCPKYLLFIEVCIDYLRVGFKVYKGSFFLMMQASKGFLAWHQFLSQNQHSNPSTHYINIETPTVQTQRLYIKKQIKGTGNTSVEKYRNICIVHTFMASDFERQYKIIKSV